MKQQQQLWFKLNHNSLRKSIQSNRLQLNEEDN